MDLRTGKHQVNGNRKSAINSHSVGCNLQTFPKFQVQ